MRWPGPGGICEEDASQLAVYAEMLGEGVLGLIFRRHFCCLLPEQPSYESGFGMCSNRQGNLEVKGVWYSKVLGQITPQS